jgi:hypothetical protein
VKNVTFVLRNDTVFLQFDVNHDNSKKTQLFLVIGVTCITPSSKISDLSFWGWGEQNSHYHLLLFGRSIELSVPRLGSLRYR